MPVPFSDSAQLTSPTSGRVGIIDIGSNSLRLVVYDQLKRAPVPLYNEKVMCQLGKGLASSGKLHAEGVTLAVAAVRRFLAMARNMEVSSLHVMATAAVRDAKDGPAFAAQLEREHDIEVEIISGDREARLGAYGICASVHEPDGITGDLGGGSMELVRLKAGKIAEHTTLPIGSLRLADETKGNKEQLKKLISNAFETVPWISKSKSDDFYAIGGSFRAIAKLHMQLTEYPLRILHQYTAEAKDFAAFAGELAAMPEEKIAALPGMPGKRVTAIAPAATILHHVLKASDVKNIVFSASGIREGYLFEALPPYVRDQDALLASCTDIASRPHRASGYAGELMVWMQPLLDKRELEEERRLRWALCLLSDIAHHIHPEHRAEWAMQRILQSSFVGLTHTERVQLALGLFHRYQFRMRQEAPELTLLNARARNWARLVGSAANLAYHLTGGIDGSLHQTSLVIEKKEVRLQFSKAATNLMGEAITKRIGGVDEAWRKWAG